MKRFGICFILALVPFAADVQAEVITETGLVGPGFPSGSFTSAPLCSSLASGVPYWENHCFAATSEPSGAKIWNFGEITGNAHAYPVTTEFGSNSLVTGLTIDQTGTVWFAGTGGSASFIGSLKRDGQFTKYTINLSSTAFVGATYIGMAVAPDDTICVTEPNLNNIACINASEQITEFHNPDPAQLQDIVHGSDGNFYVSNFGGSSSSGTILKFTRQGAFTSKLIPPIGSALSRPGFCAQAADDTAFCTDRSQNAIIEVDTSGNFNITAHPIPLPNSGLAGIAIGQDAKLYFAEVGTGKLGQFNIRSGEITDFSGLPSTPLLYLEKTVTVAPGSVTSLLAVDSFQAAGLQLSRIDLHATSPCPPESISLSPRQLTFFDGKPSAESLSASITGGAPPYSLSNIEGLPSGLGTLPFRSESSDLGITGTPQEDGSFEVTATFVDANGCPVTGTFVVQVLPAAGPPCTQSEITNTSALCLQLFGTGSNVEAGPLTTQTPLRFWLTLSAVDPRTGNIGIGQAIPQKDSFGYFSFPSFTFDATFPEVMVKMVDGRAISCCFWFFHTGLTDLQYTLTVVDTVTGNYKQYQNDRSDPSKLCGAADTQFFDGVTPRPASFTGVPIPSGGNIQPESGSMRAELFSENRILPSAAASCVANESTVCLLGNRFSATLTAHDPRSGNDGVGHAIPQKDGFGYFSLPSFTFDATFPEVFVKMVDGRVLNNSFWVFHSGLTDLEYTLTITDTTDGSVQVYHNDRSDPSKLCGAADTKAFE